MKLPSIPNDKATHFIYFSMGVWLLMMYEVNWMVIIGVVVAIGAAKELIHDGMFNLGKAEWGDMVANMLPLMWLLTKL